MSTTQIQFNAKTRFFTIATAGHVDHGKTSLLRKLTGIDPDRLKEEKERQMTTDLGFAFLPLGTDLVLGFVDVPGHGKFLKNMLAGVGGIDLALLVVAADEGPMPQTRQHLRILSLLGVGRAIVAITKVDLVKQIEQIELVQEEIEALLRDHGIEALAFCQLSSSTGKGFDELKSALQTVLAKMPERSLDGALLLPVDRVFSKAGFGTVITGTLVAGKIAVGDQIFVEPGDLKARVRRLETHGQSVDLAHPGQRVACNLVLKEGEKLSRGFVLSGEKVSTAKTLIVSIHDKPRLLPQALSDRLSDQPIRLYHGTAEYQGYLRWVEDIAASNEGENRGAPQEGLGFIALNEGAVLSAQDRFVIRLTDDTIYGGSILLRDRPRFLSKGEVIELAKMLEAGQFEESLLYYVNHSPLLMLKDEQLSAILPDRTCRQLLPRLLETGRIVRLGDFVLSNDSRKLLASNLVEKIAALLHALETKDEGVGLEAVRQAMHPRIERAAFQTLVDQEAAAGKVVRKGDKLLLPGSETKKELAPELAEAESKILQTLQSHWCLEHEEISDLSKVDLKTVKSVLQSLTKSGRVVIASYDFFASKERIDAAHQVLADLWTAKRSISPTDFKERIGVTRKYAMALLQYFDDAKITRRLESGRVLLRGPGK